MKVIIREGSAAKNFEALIDLLPEYYQQMMFCSDDKHPDSLLAGHINELVNRAISKGIDVFKVFTAACINPVIHYGLPVGLLNEGDPADFIVLNGLENFKVKQTFINGECVAERRQRELIEKGELTNLNEVEENLKLRDFHDSTRIHSPLVKAENAVEIDTTFLTLDEQVDMVVELAFSRMLVDNLSQTR